jgi:hypothetical protein
MVNAPTDLWAYKTLPAFLPRQFSVKMKTVGLPSFADEVVLAQGSIAERRFVAAYGYKGRIIAALTVNMARWLLAYRAMIVVLIPILWRYWSESYSCTVCSRKRQSHSKFCYCQRILLLSTSAAFVYKENLNCIGIEQKFN